MDEVTCYELSLLGEHLHAVAATFANVDQTVGCDMDAMERRCKLLLVGRRTRLPVVRRSGIVVNFTQWNPMAAPTALECAGIHVVNENAFRIHDVYLVSILVQIEEKDAAR